MRHKTKVLYITGKPGVGKYTIAKALQKKHEFIICDNQLINNPIFELCQYDGYGDLPEQAWQTIANIRTEIFSFLGQSLKHNYILTNCLADIPQDKRLYESVQNMAAKRDSIFIPIQLIINKEEHLKRLTKTERLHRWKSIDPQDAEDNGPLLRIQDPNFLQIDVSFLEPDDVAEILYQHMQSILSQE